MDIEKVIETLEKLTLCGICIGRDDGCKNCDKYKAKALALSALREKAERDNGCEYCKQEEQRNDSSRIFYKEFPHDTSFLTTLDDAHLQLAYDNKSRWVLHFEDESGDRMFDVKILDCPMCGRKLGENDER